MGGCAWSQTRPAEEEWVGGAHVTDEYLQGAPRLLELLPTNASVSKVLVS